MSTNNIFDRDPMTEIGKRTAEAGAGIAAAARAAALENFRANQTAHRKRVADSHAAGMQAMGFEVDQMEEDAMGDIIVTGDIYSDTAINALKGQMLPQLQNQEPQEQPKTESQSKGLLKSLANTALGAALLASGAGLGSGIPWLLGAFDKPELTDTDTLSNVEAVQLWQPETPDNQGE